LTGDQTQQSRLAGAARTHHRRDFAARYLNIQPGEYRTPANGVVQIPNINYGSALIQWYGLLRRSRYDGLSLRDLSRSGFHRGFVFPDRRQAERTTVDLG